LRIAQRYTDQPSSKLADSVKKGNAAKSLPVQNLAASAQAAIIDALVAKTQAAAAAFQVKEVLISGGVSANSLLRREMTAQIDRPVRYPPLFLCTDNAAMIGAAAHWHYQAGRFADWDLDVIPNLRLG
jgi:N6-L-threonylcarbamoyladenine synthase